MPSLSLTASLNPTASTLEAPDLNHLSLPAGLPHLKPFQSDTLFPTELNDDEKIWSARYFFLLDRGLELRPRYRPGWTPSWLGTNKDPSYCEDSIELMLYMVLDARRQMDGKFICLKMLKKKTEEAEIAQYLYSEQLKDDPRNHSVPIYDHFWDPISPEIHYLVMPVLRPFNDPELWAVGEVTDFVSQILEGMAFMHSHLVAHEDLTTQNIMMDARPLYPQGWHFVDNNYSLDGIDHLTPLARIDNPVRYYIIDYDCSVRLKPGQPHLIHGDGGRDADVPELMELHPFDPFKVDVFTVGNMLLKEFYRKYLGLDFLSVLINNMMAENPEHRPTAEMALAQWSKIKAIIKPSMARNRLRKPDESIGERVMLNTVAVARQGLHGLRALFRDDPTAW